MIRKFFRHIRTKLMLWHIATVALVVLAYSGTASLLLIQHLRTQLIRHAIQELETVEGLLYITYDRKVGVHEDYHNSPESKAVLQRLLEIRSPDGKVLYRNALLGERSLGGNPFPGEGVRGYSPRAYVMSDGLSVQMVSRRHAIGRTDVIIRLAYSEIPLWKQFREVLVVLLLPLPLVLVLTGVSGYLLARRLLQPVHQMAQRAGQITGARLHERLPLDEADGEFAELAEVFNSMLARLEQSFEQLRRFTSDASHELRTPLAAIRSVGEVSLQRHATADEYRDIIGSMLEEANRLTRLVDSLLTISRADAKQIVLHPTRFTGFHLVEECAALLDVLVEERAQRIEILGDHTAELYGDWLLLRQALLNVVHNAIKHSPPGSVIRIELRSHYPDHLEIDVHDEGPGIPEGHVDLIFHRFYRVDAARSRDTGGVGLGLSITKWIVEAHNGSIRVHAGPDGGATVCIVVPLSTNAASLADPVPANSHEVARQK